MIAPNDIVRVKIPAGEPEGTRSGKLGYVVATPKRSGWFGSLAWEADDEWYWVMIAGESGPRRYREREIEKVEA